MAKPKFHVSVVGAGLGGLAAAIAIARGGHIVTIFEQAPMLAEVGAGIQIPPNTSRILKRWNILPQIESCAVRPQDFIFRSYRDGAILSTQNMVPYCEDRYHAPYLHIHRADYHEVLAKHARELGVTIRLNSVVVSIDWKKPSIITDKGQEFVSDLIIAADGLKSICRQLLLGHPDPPHLTGDLTYRIVMKTEDMRKHPELSELTANPAINYWMGPNCHVVCYLLKGGELCNLVLACPDNLPEGVNVAAANIEEMKALFKGWDPRLSILLGMVQETQKWKLQNSEEMRFWRHPNGKFALLGDACHSTLPYLAQGAAQAVEDGAVLGSLLEQIEHKSQLQDILIIYERLRKERTTRIVKGSTALREIFHYPDGDFQKERDRQLLEQEPFEGYPNRWADPVFQKFMFAYDAYGEAERAWKLYKDGKFPGTAGKFRARM
ncbi:MAG: hypothetical protein M1834_005988 [Cirrosporium novae-zelandiae]|nr:MAG: hypothetical protein M1834_005988 [Cirrosporium novae-zelandiae]